MESKRIESIDHAKAICIILMVVGHAFANYSAIVSGGLQGEILKFSHGFIYQFHMPFFFFASGIFIKEHYLSRPGSFIAKRIRRLWVPYFVWNMVFLCIHNALFRIGAYPPEVGPINGTADYIEKTIRIVFFAYRDFLIAQIWFICALFWGGVTFCLMAFIVKRLIPGEKDDETKGQCKGNRRTEAAVLLAISAILFIVGINISLPSDLFMSQGLVAVLFLCFGHIYGRYYEHIPFNPVFGLASLVIVVICSFIHPATDMYSRDYGYPVIFLIAAMAGIYLVLFLSDSLANIKYKSRFFLFIGKNTMSIMILHFAVFKIISFILLSTALFPDGAAFQYPTILYYDRGLWSILAFVIYSICGIMIPVFAALLSERIGYCLKGIMRLHSRPKE